MTGRKLSPRPSRTWRQDEMVGKFWECLRHAALVYGNQAWCLRVLGMVAFNFSSDPGYVAWINSLRLAAEANFPNAMNLAAQISVQALRDSRLYSGYIQDTLKLTRQGMRVLRVYVPPSVGLTPEQQARCIWMSEVYPAFAEEAAGEQIFIVTPEWLRAAGIEPRLYDTDLIGCGSLPGEPGRTQILAWGRTFYDREGSVCYREVASLADRRPARLGADLSYVSRVLRVAQVA